MTPEYQAYLDALAELRKEYPYPLYTRADLEQILKDRGIKKPKELLELEKEEAEEEEEEEAEKEEEPEEARCPRCGRLFFLEPGESEGSLCCICKTYLKYEALYGPDWRKKVIEHSNDERAKAIAEEAAAKAVLLQGHQVAQQVAKELSGQMLHSSPISSHCEAVLAKPPSCADFRGARSFTLCLAWKLMEEEKLPTLPVGRAWAQLRQVCQRE